MASSRALWVAGFASLVVTSVWWVWLIFALWSVHWPNNGQQLVAIPLLVACAGIIGYGAVSTSFATLGRSAQSVAPVILELVSITSLLVIIGGAAVLIAAANGAGVLLLGDIFPVAGLAGSLAGAILYERIRSYPSRMSASLPPAGRDTAGGSA